MIARSLISIAAFAVAGCSSADGKADNANIVHQQIGRFQFMPARDGFPPLILDTAAGCVMAISKDEAGQVSVDEVNFPDGTNSCRASKQLLVVDTLSRIANQ